MTSFLRSSLAIGLLLSTFWVTAAPATDLSHETIYDRSKVLDVTIELPESDWKQLCAQTRDPRGVFSGRIDEPFTYFEGKITIDGVQIDAVGLRKKGFIGSLDDQFPSLRIKFDEFVDQQPIAGVDGLTLNNNKQDLALVSQTLAYELFNAAGVTASRCTFAKVTVNGKFLGIYSNVESISKPMLKRRFGNDTGNLYEGTLADFYPPAIDRIEIKTNKKKHDRSQLDRLAKMLAEEEQLNIEQLNELVDIDNFLRYWAIESLIGFWDGYTNNQNNYWIYQNSKDGKFYFMPWGADAAFMQSGFPAFGPTSANSIYAESLLANRLIQDQAIAERYRSTMRWVLKNVWNEAALIERIDIIEELLGGERHSRQSGSTRSMQDVRNFIKRRRVKIERELDAWPVRVPQYARKPMYVVPVGSVTGGFQTTWTGKPLTNLSSKKNAEMTVTIDDQPVAFEAIGVSMHPAPRGFMGFGPPMPPGPPLIDIVVEGVQAGEKRTARISLSIAEAVAKTAVGKALEVDGFYLPDVNAGGFGMPIGGKTLAGTIRFSELGLQVGDAIEATFDLSISEVRGGFMNRDRVEPGK
jgi:spore coat protein CotH